MKQVYLLFFIVAQVLGQSEEKFEDSNEELEDLTEEELIELENQKILDELRKGEQEDDTVYLFDPN